MIAIKPPKKDSLAASVSSRAFLLFERQFGYPPLVIATAVLVSWMKLGAPESK